MFDYFIYKLFAGLFTVAIEFYFLFFLTDIAVVIVVIISAVLVSNCVAGWLADWLVVFQATKVKGVYNFNLTAAAVFFFFFC